MVEFFALILLMVIIGLLFWVLMLWIDLKNSRPIVNCHSFSTYNEALRAYNAGNKRLDGGKHNGVPCESLVKK